MPEVPEIKAHAERLATSFAGKTLIELKAHKFSTLKTFNPAPEQLSGKNLESVSTRGKYLQLNFSDDYHCVTHLMQGGRLKEVGATKAKKSKQTIAHFTFEDSESALLFTEAGSERKAGIWLFDGDPTPLEPLAKLGPEADGIEPETLKIALGSNRGRIHKVLRDQSTIAGIGRMLANEICHRAKLSPFANTSKLDQNHFELLLSAIQDAISAATEYERSLTEIGAAADRPSLVHNRVGEQCLTCDENTIHSVEYSSYTVAYCPTCQTNGKQLADNTTSKFLK